MSEGTAGKLERELASITQEDHIEWLKNKEADLSELLAIGLSDQLGKEDRAVISFALKAAEIKSQLDIHN